MKLSPPSANLSRNSTSPQSKTMERSSNPPSPPVAVGWWMSGDVFRVQANTPAPTKSISKLPGARQVGYSVAGSYLKLFDFISNEKYIRRIIEEIGGVFLPEPSAIDFPKRRAPR